MKPEILYTRLFRRKFMNCLSRRPVSLRVAAPYVGKIPGFGSIVALAQSIMHSGCKKFQLITAPPESEAGSIRLSEAELISQMGVDVMILNRLHSKIYQFGFPEGDQAAFVGSANFTAGGFERNYETVAFFREKMDNGAVFLEFQRLSMGAPLFEHWRTKPVKNLAVTGGESC